MNNTITRRELSARIDALTSQILGGKNPQKFIQVSNKLGKLKLGTVTGDSINKLLSELAVIFGATAAKNGMNFGGLTNHAENAADALEIEIHSPGGSVFDGLRLYHEIVALRSRGVFVTARINTLAASMGSVIAMAADRIVMVPSGKMMIHDVSSSAGGTAADHARSAKLCDDMSNDLANIYSKKTGHGVADLRELMKRETWLSAKQALAEKFIDSIDDGTTPAKAQASASILDQYNNMQTGPEKRAFLAEHAVAIQSQAKL